MLWLVGKQNVSPLILRPSMQFCKKPQVPIDYAIRILNIFLAIEMCIIEMWSEF